MSVTTTANPSTYTLSATLSDYHIHHSESRSLDTSLNPHPIPSSRLTTQLARTQNPPHWPSEYRRIPDYRPVNTELDQSARRVYQNRVERMFVGVMFTGVLIEATVAKVWRATMGRIWDVGYQVGGEW